MKRGWHAMSRVTQTRPSDGAHVLQFGCRLGYWPCLRAPFVQIAFGKWLLDVWYGGPSHL